MAQTKFTLYKYVKLQGGWRYCKAAFHENVKIKPNVVIVGKDKHEEKHPEGSHYLAHAGQWIPVGDNALEAQRRQKQQKSLAEYQRLTGTAPVQSSGAVTASGKTPLLAAAAKYFSNLEARGLDAKTIRTYRTGVDPFVENCARTYVEDVTKQDMSTSWAGSASSRCPAEKFESRSHLRQQGWVSADFPQGVRCHKAAQEARGAEVPREESRHPPGQRTECAVRFCGRRRDLLARLLHRVYGT